MLLRSLLRVLVPCRLSFYDDDDDDGDDDDNDDDNDAAEVIAESPSAL